MLEMPQFEKRPCKRQSDLMRIRVILKGSPVILRGVGDLTGLLQDGSIDIIMKGSRVQIIDRRFCDKNDCVTCIRGVRMLGDLATDRIRPTAGHPNGQNRNQKAGQPVSQPPVDLNVNH